MRTDSGSVVKLIHSNRCSLVPPSFRPQQQIWRWRFRHNNRRGSEWRVRQWHHLPDHRRLSGGRTGPTASRSGRYVSVTEGWGWDLVQPRQNVTLCFGQIPQLTVKVTTKRCSSTPVLSAWNCRVLKIYLLGVSTFVPPPCSHIVIREVLPLVFTDKWKSCINRTEEWHSFMVRKATMVVGGGWSIHMLSLCCWKWSQLLSSKNFCTKTVQCRKITGRKMRWHWIILMNLILSWLIHTYVSYSKILCIFVAKSKQKQLERTAFWFEWIIMPLKRYLYWKRNAILFVCRGFAEAQEMWPLRIPKSKFPRFRIQKSTFSNQEKSRESWP